jgi:hypothetical protein
MSTAPPVTHDLYDVELPRIDAHIGTLYFAGSHLLTLTTVRTCVGPEDLT